MTWWVWVVVVVLTAPWVATGVFLWLAHREGNRLAAEWVARRDEEWRVLVADLDEVDRITAEWAQR